MTDGQYYGARKLRHNIAAIYCCVCHRPNACNAVAKASNERNSYKCLLPANYKRSVKKLLDWYRKFVIQTPRKMSSAFSYVLLMEVSNVEVRATTGCRPLSHLVTDRRLRLFGHIARSSPQEGHHRAVAAVIRGLPPDWKRPLGRPSHT